ncbi:hypothetical protein MRX96_055634 [Rhipicephalus microplus]
MVPVAPPTESDVPTLDAHRAACPRALRAFHRQDSPGEWFRWLCLPSPMFQRWMLIVLPVEELFVRATVKIPLRERFRWLRLPSSMFQCWMLIVLLVEELFARATVKIPRREWFGWLRLLSPMFQRWMLIVLRVEELFVRSTIKIPLREWFRWLRLPSPMFQRSMFIVLRVVEFCCWFMLLRLLIALSAITVCVLGTLLIAAMVVGGPTLLFTLADFMVDTLREVFITCNQFLQDPAQEHMCRKAWKGLNI